MKFQVPQFIEVEDKIFGPLTLKQFIYLAGGAGLSVVFYLIFPLIIGILFILPIMLFALALAFFKVNNKPFINFLEAAVVYTLKPRLYIWLKTDNKAEQQSEDQLADDMGATIPKLSNSKLKDMTWNLDTHK